MAAVVVVELVDLALRPAFSASGSGNAVARIGSHMMRSNLVCLCCRASFEVILLGLLSALMAVVVVVAALEPILVLPMLVGIRPLLQLLFLVYLFIVVFKELITNMLN